MDEPLWYKDAVFYELHVRAFQDGNGDGIGDFAGLTQRLDYLADLGITAVWLLPFTVSPLKDDGYDIADYTNVHPNYGTLDDFRQFLEKAHAVGIRVITELVINHTSDQHPWFQRARRAPAGSPERNFYVWSDSPEKYAGVPLMFPDFESSNWAWDPIAKQYYWHRFYSHQPDLNFDNPAVREAILPLVDFWFEMGVDGMRLDAVPYLIEREGTACEHLPETHAFLKDLRKHVDGRFPGRMFLAEANAWPDDMVAYFGKGDECQMAFHFPLMPRLFMALHQEDRFPITDILAQTPAIPETSQWCLFLRNHDELTLAMITDEERDAMYSAYARDRQARLFLGIRHRLAPLLTNDRRQIELMNAILFSLPGTPVIYYGDEIGMGDNIYLGDRNGVRTPMQWSDDRNAGFSRANSQKVYLPVIVDSEYHYEAVNVEAQQNNSSSLLWWMKRLIALRKHHPAFGRGDLRLLEPDNSKVLAYVRQTDSECLLVVANLSRFVQNVQLDLASYAGLIPEELFGRSRFPIIREGERYGLTLGPHGFYWFSLAPEKTTHTHPAELPSLTMREWSDLSRGRTWETLSGLLVSRQLSGSPLQIVGCRFLEQKPLPIEDLDARLFIFRIEYASNQFETCFQSLALVSGERFEGDNALPHSSAVARTAPTKNVILCDPHDLPEYKSTVLAAFTRKKSFALASGEQVTCTPLGDFVAASEIDEDNRPPAAVIRDFNFSTFVINDRLLMRVFRRPDEGLNPDVELGTFLQQQDFKGFAEIVGTVDYRRPGSETIALAALHRFVANQGTAWQLILNQTTHLFENVAAQSSLTAEDFTKAPAGSPHAGQLSERAEFLISPFLHTAKLLAAYSAQLHLTLASATTVPAMAPISANQRSFYQTLRNSAGRLHAMLAEVNPAWPKTVRELAIQVRDNFQTILGYIYAAVHPNLASGRRIRCHGNFHLPKLLISGHDFILSDFEGLRDRPVGERRIKHSPMLDVASLFGSLNYAVNSVRLELTDKADSKSAFIRHEDHEKLEPCAMAWLSHWKREFFEDYVASLESSDLLPNSQEGREQLLDLSCLEDAFGNAEYDLAERPEWAVVPLTTILTLIGRVESKSVPNDVNKI